ncbi:MAG: hypothetical protein U0289_04715 [Cyclobacteriaceae bacterium]|nr:hypothetical protein [Cyclobacteriaceae bacterium]
MPVPLKLIRPIKIFLFTAFILGPACLFAAQQELDFKPFGGDSLDRAIHLVPLNKSGYLMTGMSSSFGRKEDALIVRLDKALKPLWQRTYGGPGLDFAWGVQELSHGGYMISGFTNSFGNGGLDAWILRLDNQGDTLWTQTIGGTKDERAVMLIQTYDGNFVVIGQTDSWGNGSTDVLLVKISGDGQLLWKKTFGGEKSDRGFNVLEMPNHDLILSGITENNEHHDTDALLIRTTSTGDLIWKKTYGHTGVDVAHFLLLRDNQNLVMAGYEEYTSGLHEPMLVEVDRNGNLLNKVTYKVDGDARIMAGYFNKKNEFIGIGYAMKNGRKDWDFYFIHTDKELTLKESMTYGGDKDDQGYSICQDPEGGSLGTGHSYSTTNSKGDAVLYRWKN